MIIPMVFKKNAFFGKKIGKLAETVIITLTSECWLVKKHSFFRTKVAFSNKIRSAVHFLISLSVLIFSRIQNLEASKFECGKITNADCILLQYYSILLQYVFTPVPGTVCRHKRACC
jgi:hypothetical protein